jgi:hypothetical protein
MLTPATVDLKVYRTGTFATKLLLWKNQEPKEQFPLSEYTVELVITGLFNLKPAAGLTISENEIAIQLTATQTGSVTTGARAHYYLKLTKGEEVVFPMRGSMTFIDP